MTDMKRRSLLLGSLGIATLSLAGCGNDSNGGGNGGGGDKGGEKEIAIVAKGYASPFWAAVKKGCEDGGKEYGYKVTFNGPDTETDVPRQNDQLNQAIVRNPVALGFAALDSEAQGSVLQQFADKNIPVIAFDSGVPGSDIPKTTVATNNKGAAAEAAEHMAELIGKKGKVAIICHSQTSLTGQDREQGFRDWMKDNAPDVEIVDVQYNNSDQAVAQQQSAAILQAHPDLAGMFSTDDDGAVGAAQSVKTAGRTGQVVVVGFDSGKPQMELIRSGEIAGSVSQNPYMMGKQTIEMADKVLKGESLEKFVDSGSFWYDKTNIDDEKFKDALYE